MKGAVSLRVVRRSAAHPGTTLGGLHPVLGRVYAARGVRTAEELDNSLERLLPVGTLEGIPAAVQLLLRHRDGRVLIIGDFDADGATSSALMVRALGAAGFTAPDFLVPNRFQFGYGLTPEIVALAAQRAPTLIVTHVGNQAIVSWDPSATGWILQTNNNLSTGTWGNYLGQVVNNSVTNSPPTGNLFFRLTQP